MNRLSLFAIFLTALSLGGCTLGPKTSIFHEYALHLGGGMRPARPVQSILATLQIARIGASDWLNSRNIYYQFTYLKPAEISAYSKSRWLTPPPAMLQNLLVDALARGHVWKAVTSPASTAQTDYSLQVHLIEFRQVFSSLKHSQGMLVVRASLIKMNGDSVVAEKIFKIKVPAPSPNAQGGVIALNEASRHLIQAIGNWLMPIQALSNAGKAT